MSILKPNEGESQDTYVERCMVDKDMKEKFPDNKRRLAVILSKFKNPNSKRDEKGRVIVAENVPVIIAATIEVRG